MSKANALFVVIYPYKFTEFLYELTELEFFKGHVDVLVLDVAEITNPNFSKRISAERSVRDEIVKVTSWRCLIRHLLELRRRSQATNICVQNVVPYVTPKEFLCNLAISILLRKRVTMFDLYISGTPVYAMGEAAEKSPPGRSRALIDAACRFAWHSTTPIEAIKKISAVMLRALARLTPLAITHRLVAGKDWMALAQAHGLGAGRVKIVHGHSHDYSNNLIRERSGHNLARPAIRTAVLLDAAGPMFGDDYVYMGRKVYLTSDIWYPALTKFFDQLEELTGVRIVIAGHYKSAHPSIAPHFGNREVHYGKTRELIYNCDFVLTRQSAATAYAVIFRKPVVFIYSDQIRDDLRAMRGIGKLAALLGNDPVNIDRPIEYLSQLLQINESKYASFERAYLTSAGSRRPNSQIILEDIMGIPTSAPGSL
jgi:hypothetical protein